MNIPLKTFVLLLGAALLSNSTTFAEDPPVEVFSEVLGCMTVTANANSDLKVGIPLLQAPSFTGAADTVTAGVVGVTSTIPDVTTAAHFLWVTSGPLLGDWYAVESSTSNSVTVAEDLESLGMVVADAFVVVPFWTLDTLFPNGGGVPASPEVSSSVGQVKLNNPAAEGVNLVSAASYLYHDGTKGPAGWYDVDHLGDGLQGGVLVTPASYITIRNYDSSPASIVLTGGVPSVSLANRVLSRSAGYQDSQIPNPFPVGMTLSNSGLVTSGVLRASPEVSGPLDVLKIFEAEPTGLNPVSLITVLYHDGSKGPAGWYDIDHLGDGVIDDYVIPAGAALILRRGVGPDAVFSWSPATPYTL